MRLVLEHDEIFFRFSVDFRVDTDRAGVDFVRNVEVVKLSVLFQLLCRNRRKVHQAGIFIGAGTVDFLVQIAIEMIRLLHRTVFRGDFDVFQLRRKRGMAAVIRPIRIDDFELRLRRISALVLEIIAHESEVLRAHRKADFFMIGGNFLVRPADKALHVFDVRAFQRFAPERRGLFQTDFLALHGVDEVLFDGGKLFVRNAFHRVHLRAFDEGTRLFREELHALRRTVRALVVLTRQKTDGKYLIAFGNFHGFQIYVIHGRFGKNRAERRGEFRLAQSLHVVSQNQTEILRIDIQQGLDVRRFLLRLYVVLLLYKNSVNHTSPYYSAGMSRYLIPMSFL